MGIGPTRPMWYSLNMTQDHNQSDFDFGYQTGINRFAQQGIETANTLNEDEEQDFEHAQRSSFLCVITFLIVGAAVIALPYFF
ncbi:hypothetical protein [Erythrobacter sp.]|jgi:hypothetical protein|uniref:hypothetical protein n=1 Tax=Erythrobacter sp. TaxID=1042 RepID=UPI002EAD4554|nr:hypothetical protein [Erythrobacter sp.]